jgi:hypothetical protein
MCIFTWNPLVAKFGGHTRCESATGIRVMVGTSSGGIQKRRLTERRIGGVVCKGCLRLQTTTSKSAPKRCRPSTSRGGIRVLYVEDYSRLAAPEVTRDEPPPPPLDPVRLYLPRILHNARLASMVCDDFVNTLQTGRLYQRSWQPTEDPYTDSLRAYYMMRHIALAWDYPQLRPAVMSTLSESSYNMLTRVQAPVPQS